MTKRKLPTQAAIWPAEPWEITAATERLVISGKLAYSRGEATANNVDWLSLPHSSSRSNDKNRTPKNEARRLCAGRAQRKCYCI